MIIDPNQAVEFLKDIPPEVATFIIGMTPVFELRGAIPVAIGAYQMSVPSAFFWAAAGNIFVAILLVLFLEKISIFLSSHFEIWKKLYFVLSSNNMTGSFCVSF